MSYYCLYKLNIKQVAPNEPENPYDQFMGKTEATPEAIMKAFRARDSWAEYALREDGSTEQSLNGWEYEDSFTPLSKEFPNFLFMLDIYGEDFRFWRCYFLNGKMQQVKGEVAFPEYNVSQFRPCR